MRLVNSSKTGYLIIPQLPNAGVGRQVLSIEWKIALGADKHANGNRGHSSNSFHVRLHPQSNVRGSNRIDLTVA